MMDYYEDAGYSIHGEARLPPCRLRLYDVYRQQRAPAGSRGRGGPIEKLVVASVLSGNRNFEGRINSLVRANYLASPPLVVAYALAGRMDMDLLKDRWVRMKRARRFTSRTSGRPRGGKQTLKAHVREEMFQKQYSEVFEGDANWRGMKSIAGESFDWERRVHLHQAPAIFRRDGRSRTVRCRT